MLFDQISVIVAIISNEFRRYAT